jgi:hypothetical protein
MANDSAPVHKQQLSAVAPPPAFPLLFVLVCFHALISFAYFHARTALFFSAAVLGSSAIIYFFWRRQNWARIVVILTAITDLILDIPRLAHSPASTQAVLILRLITAATLLVWLNTSTVRAYFHRTHLTPM